MANTISKQTDPVLKSTGKVERMKNTYVPSLTPYQYEKNILLEKQGYVTVFPGATAEAPCVEAGVPIKKMSVPKVNSEGVLLKK